MRPLGIAAYGVLIAFAALATNSSVSAHADRDLVGRLDIGHEQDGSSQSITVSYEFPDALPAKSSVRLPDSWGGATGLSKLIDLASDERGSWLRVGQDRNICSRHSATRLAYRVRTDRRASEAEYLAPLAGKGWAFAFGNAILLSHPPAGDYKIGLRGAGFSNLSGKPSTTVSSTRLSDSFFLMGDRVHLENRALTANSTMRLAWPEDDFALSAEDYALIAQAVVDMAAASHSWPADYSVSLVPFHRADRQAAFHGVAVRDGIAILLSGDQSVSEYQNSFYHEIAHQITGYETGSIDGVAISNDEYWFYEGITDAIARIVMRNRGRISESAYRSSWTSVVQSLDEDYQRTTLPANDGHAKEHSAEYQYWRGALIGLSLHLRLQSLLADEDGLIAVLRRTATLDPSAEPIDNFRDAIRQVNPDLDVYLTAVLADHRKLEFFGDPTRAGCLKLVNASVPRFELGFAFTPIADGAYRIDDVVDGTAADRAGLRAGMIVTEIIASSGGDPAKQTVFTVAGPKGARRIAFFPRTSEVYPQRRFEPCLTDGQSVPPDGN